MERCIEAAMAAVLIAVGLIAAAPAASAGCVYGGPGILGKCDGPIAPDGSWERCVAVANLVINGASSYVAPVKNCDVMGPGQFPADLAFADPPAHIDD
ncbi:hypothetical protein [Mycobacterium sp.]|uniref:CDGP domain-containing protein n=1 Tax=Mycobacterium sp. TaxID=1785 RepID=UPI003A8C7DB6